MLAPGVLLWLVLPAALGPGLRAVAPVWVGAVAGVAALVLAIDRPVLGWLVPAILAVELAINGLTGDALTPMPAGPGRKLPRAMPAATAAPNEALRPDALTEALAAAGGRYLTVVPGEPDVTDTTTDGANGSATDTPTDVAGDDGALFPNRALLFD